MVYKGPRCIFGPFVFVTECLLIRYNTSMASSDLLGQVQTLFHLPEVILVEKAKQGDRDAFGTLYQKYLDGIYRYVYFRVGKREIAEDITATVFAKAWEKLSSYIRVDGSLKAWLYTIAHNLVIDYYREKKEYVGIPEHVEDGKESIESAVAKKVQVEQILEKVRQLPEEQQQVLLLRFVEDMSHKEISYVLGKREDAVRAQVSRALKALRKEFI